MRIGLFITCLTDTFLPRVGVAVVRVLEHLGHTVEFPAEQTCCGQAHYNNGAHDEARGLVRRMTSIFEGYDAVVTPSGSCAAMIVRHGPELFPPGTPERAAAESLARRTHEFCQFLIESGADLREAGATWAGKATYHPACHLRDLGTDAAPAVAAMIDGLELLPLSRADQCCGFGGTFAVTFGPVSGSMVRDKVACATRTGADTLIVNDGGCAMNIGGCLHREGGPALRSLAEIVAESLGLLPREDGASTGASGGTASSDAGAGA